MKKIVIIGAGGSLAQYVIEALKQPEHTTLTLFARIKTGCQKILLKLHGYQ